MKQYKYLTFDCYGTLVDWKSGIQEALTSALGSVPLNGKELLDIYVAAERGEEEAYRSYREVMASTAMKLARSFGRELTPASAAAFGKSPPFWPPFPDTADALRELGRLGYRRFILSNVDTDLLRGTIVNNGFEVEGYVTAEDVHSYKPEPGHWIRFMEETGAKRDEVLHVAQSVQHDILPAASLGIDSAWVDRYREPLPKGAQPAIICDSLADLARVLA